MEQFNYLSIDEVISTIDASLDNEDTRYHRFYKNWIWRAMQQIGVDKTDIKTVCHDVINFSFDKPCDMVYPIAIDLLDNENNATIYVYKGTDWMKADVRDPSTIQDLVYSPVFLGENKTCYFISTNSEHVKKAQIKYYSYPVDENGEYLVPSSYIEAIIAYIKLEIVDQKLHKGDKTAVSLLGFKRDNWMYELRQARQNRKTLDMLTGSAISKAWMSKIPNFRTRTYTN